MKEIALLLSLVLLSQTGFSDEVRRNLAVTPPSADAATPVDADWMLPPTAQIGRPAIEPQRVFDIKASGLLGVTAGHVLPDGRIVFWGDAEQVTGRAISLIDPASGKIETLWRGDALSLRTFILTPDRQALWFSTVAYGQPDRFYVLDLATHRVWPMEDIYGDGVTLLLQAIKDNQYWVARMAPDGRLLLEWQRWYSIANWWGRRAVDWQMERPDGEKAPDVASRAYLPSPVAWLRQGDGKARLPITLEVSFEALLKHEDDRPKPRITGEERFYAPRHDGMSFSVLRNLELPEYGLSLQLFNRYRDPRSMQRCGLGNNDGNGMWSSTGSASCARYQGAYVERTADGKLVHILNHGVGVPEGVALRGRLFAMSGITENPVPARYVSLWDAVAGNLLAHLALPEEATSVAAAYPYTLLFSNDGQALYCISSYPRPKLYIWSMEKAWVRLMEGGKEPVRTNKAKKR